MKVLRLNAVYAEPHTSLDAAKRVATAIGELASWLGAKSVELPDQLPPGFNALRSQVG